MNPTQRRKSGLGRRNRNNGEMPKKPLVALLPRLPLVTPKSGLGRLKSGGKLKASNDFMIRKQLFSTSSSGKKTQFGSSSRATYSSPNDSQSSYQSDNSLNLTGVKSIKVPSPESKIINHNVMKSYQGFKNVLPSTSVETQFSLNKAKTWDARALEPPVCPPPSQYDRLIQLEMASIKPPVDPDDLINLKNLTLEDNLDSHCAYLQPITSTVNNVNVSKFSPHLSSTCVNSTFTLSTEKKENPTTFVLLNTVQTQEKVEICSSKVLTSCNKYCLDKSWFSHDNKSSSCESNASYNLKSGSLNHTSNNLELRLSSHEMPNSNSEKSQVESSQSENKMSILNRDLISSVTTDNILDSSKGTKNKIVVSANPVSRSLDFNHFEFRRPLELSKSHSSSSTVKSFETSKGTTQELFREPLKSTQSSELKHSLSISNSLPMKNHNSKFSFNDLDVTLNSKGDYNILLSASKNTEVDRKLSVINETVEKELSNEDLNTTDSFVMAEQTIIDQDQYITDPQTVDKATRSVLNNKNCRMEVHKTSESDDEIAQALAKVDAIINKITHFKSEMNEWEIELKNLKSNLQQLEFKRSKLGDKRTQNKENIPMTETKQIKKKWFNEMKSENPSLLKTPNPARQSVSRMSLANQSIMTPHSLSIVINDQLDDLFE